MTTAGCAEENEHGDNGQAAVTCTPDEERGVESAREEEQLRP